MSLTVSQIIDRFPPFVCRLLARVPVDGGRSMRGMSDREIAARGSLSLGKVKELSYAKDWDAVPVSVMLAFSSACGVDFNDRVCLKRQWALWQRGWGRHLRKHGDVGEEYADIIREVT